VATVVLDADVLIGFLYAADSQHEQAVSLLAPYLLPGHRVMIGASVYSEVLVGPVRTGRPEIVDDFLASGRIAVVPIDRPIARRAAELRAAHRALRLPDALALATALETPAELLTLDEGLRRVAARL
jgi:predicted nucleic acid-binding protein